MIEGVRFVLPDLREIDDAPAEVVGCSIFSDERPMGGLAGLLDWRLAGRLSALAKSGFLRGDVGEVLLVPGRPHVPFEKIIVLGVGPRAALDAEVVRGALDRLNVALDGLKVKRALIELPGRAGGQLDAVRGAELLMEHARGALEHEAWTLVDTTAAADAMMARFMRRPDARSRPGA